MNQPGNGRRNSSLPVRQDPLVAQRIHWLDIALLALDHRAQIRDRGQVDVLAGILNTRIDLDPVDQRPPVLVFVVERRPG